MNISISDAHEVLIQTKFGDHAVLVGKNKSSGLNQSTPGHVETNDMSLLEIMTRRKSRAE
jgi:hypothetical protein